MKWGRENNDWKLVNRYAREIDQNFEKTINLKQILENDNEMLEEV